MKKLHPDLIRHAKGVDLIALAEPHTQLRRLSVTDGGEYAGPCPLCAGKKRFHVQPGRGRWFCRHCTPRWEDSITLQQLLTGASFREAVLALASNHRSVVERKRFEVDDGPPPAEWQERAKLVILAAQDALWSRAGRVARTWLNRRGLSDDTLYRWQIGYLPRAVRDDPCRWGRDDDQPMYLAAGVLIPGVVLGEIWYLKVRRLKPRDPDEKYIQVRGSRPALYMADTIADASTVCLLEGEFDALLLWQLLHSELALHQHVGVATYGSANNRMAGRWVSQLAGRRKLILYDQDEAGRAGAAWWRAHFPDCVIPVWPAKDLTELYLHNGNAPVRQMLSAALP